MRSGVLLGLKGGGSSAPRSARRSLGIALWIVGVTSFFA